MSTIGLTILGNPINSKTCITVSQFNLVFNETYFSLSSTDHNYDNDIFFNVTQKHITINVEAFN